MTMIRPSLDVVYGICRGLPMIFYELIKLGQAQFFILFVTSFDNKFKKHNPKLFVKLNCMPYLLLIKVMDNQGNTY